jgi:flavin reductase (DIM6/NTAB) family NADH-FMN oxidoreductase RutF
VVVKQIVKGDQGDVDRQRKDSFAAALGRIPSSLFILTVRHEDRRMGMLVSWVQQIGFDPPMISIAVGKGREVLPLISETKRFALSQLAQGDKNTLRRFASRPEEGQDPFLGVDLIPINPRDPEAPTLPVLAAAAGYLECQVVYHYDVEGDHDLFIAKVVRGCYFGGEPHVHIRSNGLKY